MDHSILARRPDLVLINKQILEDFVISENYRVKIKEYT